MNLPFITLGETFPKIRIANTEFLIDGVARLFRQTSDPLNVISFERLKFDEVQGGYPVIFDKITRNVYTGYVSENGIPPMTERIVIPRIKEMESTITPARVEAMLKDAVEATPKHTVSRRSERKPKRLKY